MKTKDYDILFSLEDFSEQGQALFAFAATNNAEGDSLLQQSSSIIIQSTM